MPNPVGSVYNIENKVEELRDRLKQFKLQNCRKATNITRTGMINYFDDLGFDVLIDNIVNEDIDPRDLTYNQLKTILKNYKNTYCKRYIKMNKSKLLEYINFLKAQGGDV